VSKKDSEKKESNASKEGVSTNRSRRSINKRATHVKSSRNKGGCYNKDRVRFKRSDIKEPLHQNFSGLDEIADADGEKKIRVVIIIKIIGVFSL